MYLISISSWDLRAEVGWSGHRCVQAPGLGLLKPRRSPRAECGPGSPSLSGVALPPENRRPACGASRCHCLGVGSPETGSGEHATPPQAFQPFPGLSPCRTPSRRCPPLSPSTSEAVLDFQATGLFLQNQDKPLTGPPSFPMSPGPVAGRQRVPLRAAEEPGVWEARTRAPLLLSRAVETAGLPPELTGRRGLTHRRCTLKTVGCWASEPRALRPPGSAGQRGVASAAPSGPWTPQRTSVTCSSHG